MAHVEQISERTGPLTAKQQQIIEAACKLFTEQGYEVTSMDQVAAEANVSKRTVYSYFDSKEQLFCSVMSGMCAGFGEANTDDIDFTGDLRSVLTDCALVLLSKITDPDKVRLMRTVISEVENFPLIGQVFWGEGPGKMRDELAKFIADQQQKGVLKKTDPMLAAAQFQSVVAGPCIIQTLFTGSSDWTREQVFESVPDAVECFLKANAPE